MSEKPLPSIHVRVNRNSTFSIKIDPEAEFTFADLDRISHVISKLSTAAKLVTGIGFDLHKLYQQFVAEHADHTVTVAKDLN